jgi:hypothetical protein
MIQKEFPILEFDEDINAYIRPSNLIQSRENTPVKCVLCFFSEAIEKILQEYQYKIIFNFKSEGMNYPLYELEYKSKNMDN